MRSAADQTFSLPVTAAAPLAMLADRGLRVSFAQPAPLLRALGPGEATDGAMWSEWLASWGWAWAVAPGACAPRHALVGVWLDRGRWPPGFDARVLALAVALRLKVDGEPLVAGGENALDLRRVWGSLQRLPRESLAEVLALALLRADDTVFDFASAAPSWPADSGRVIAERRALSDEREPAPVWLHDGYRLLGDEGFGMLRAEGRSLADCEVAWDSFAAGRTLSDAFALIFWWEATYCLTERHAYEDAERAQERVVALVGGLERLTGLIDPMWHHQQGRLHYYAGNHESALAEYLREYQAHGDDLRIKAMLTREIANVLSDLVCLDGAQLYADLSVQVARAQGQRAELFKSLGRLAEIAVKRGAPAEALALYEESLAVQRRLGGDSRAPAQTLTYLGHASLLAGEFVQAAEWYRQAEVADADGSSAPYLAMGRLALALADGDVVGLTQRWSACEGLIRVWAEHPTHVLPAAVCTLAASRHVGAARDRLPALARALVANRYAVEAAFILPNLPDELREPLSREIETCLARWQKSLASIPEPLRAGAGNLDGPRTILEAMRRGTLRDSPALAAVAYPLTLAG